MKANFIVMENGQGLMTMDSSSERIFKKHPPGTVISCEVKEFRNYAFHKKWFAMVKFAYDHYSAEFKSFDTFRNEITIMAGHFEVVASLGSNSVKKIPKSISFGSMSEEEFERFYSDSINAILKAIPTLAKDKAELISMEAEIIRYA